ncbi:4Fe-4S dicluster domain-containing protein [Photobacterium profundum]|uniref:4Fe-4S ferredoxin-type domain-containing protein n=1 Tax=Photobacterium profundum 3TCK TaxID=314280 RepID=Q1YYV6_9GAMM|nr:4Fe-4S dicluster domain-containing protein [Photobacterium profundum]EAS41452.1 hypothetical protein P3TCK_06732 [Photobacterium profundum 3TCK]
MNKDNPIDRRSFFKHSFAKMVQTGNDIIEQKAIEKAKGWIRPPFAEQELDLLINCSRCGDCISACPHQVIFPLPLKRGADVAGTPAMDIINKGCHLCADWPCVTACNEKALVFPINKIDEKDSTGETENSTETSVGSAEDKKRPDAQDCPPMAKAAVNSATCLPYSGPECGACKGSCPIPDTLVWQNEKPSIIHENCVGCGLCREACITSPKAIEISPIVINSKEQPDRNLRTQENV